MKLHLNDVYTRLEVLMESAVRVGLETRVLRASDPVGTFAALGLPRMLLVDTEPRANFSTYAASLGARCRD